MFEVALTDADQAPQPRTVGEGNQRPVRTHHRPRVKPGSLLAARAATEYVYVTHDLKRISLLGVVLFGTLLLLWLLIVALRVIPLPFY